MNMVTVCLGLCYKVDVVFADNAAWLLVISKKIKKLSALRQRVF